MRATDNFFSVQFQHYGYGRTVHKLSVASAFSGLCVLRHKNNSPVKQPGDRQMPKKHIVISTDLYDGEATLELTPAFNALPALLQADLLGDVIEQAEAAYEAAAARIVPEIDADIAAASTDT